MKNEEDKTWAEDFFSLTFHENSYEKLLFCLNKSFSAYFLH